MNYITKQDEKRAVKIQLSSLEFDTGVSEYQIIITGSDASLSYEAQLEHILVAYDEIFKSDAFANGTTVLKRFFLSDAANQMDLLSIKLLEFSDSPISIVQQPPLNGTKISLWAYVQTHVKSHILPDKMHVIKHNQYDHYWTASATNEAANSEYQTKLLLNEYVLQLAEQDCTLAKNCIRTWFFVQNVDINYAGVVKGRNDVFMTQGLTRNTHFITSTGIGGRHANPHIFTQMDTYAVKGLKPKQIQYLYAPTHMNSTADYGVSFERGVCVKYGDRNQVFISGTASIDNKGAVVWPGDIVKQTHRMIENVETLLNEADCGFEDVGQILIYLRDPADYSKVKDIFDDHLPIIPKVFVHAPVCRPEWLIEMECMASKAMENKEFAPF